MLFACFAILLCPSELIDTLWNVNESIEVSVSGRFSELIDTLWNVNICIKR